jgi:hypothetical protein
MKLEKMVKLTISPGKVKVEKMEKEIVIEDKGQEQKLEDTENALRMKLEYKLENISS